MSAHHPFFTFTPAVAPSALRVRDHEQFLPNWQKQLHAQNNRWYAATTPLAPACAFALQYLLGVLAAVGVFGAATGPWRVPLSADLAFELGPHHTPERIAVTCAVAQETPLEERLAGAQAAYLEVALPIARGYQPLAPLGLRQREVMVADVWAMALRDAASLTGGSPAPVQRQGCCFIYALPGCHECAGCPRLGD